MLTIDIRWVNNKLLLFKRILYMNMNVLYTLFFAFLLNETNIKASSIPLAIVVSEILLFQDQGKEDKNIGIELARKAKSSGDHKLAAYTYLNLINKFPDQISILTEYTSFEHQFAEPSLILFLPHQLEL